MGFPSCMRARYPSAAAAACSRAEAKTRSARFRSRRITTSTGTLPLTPAKRFLRWFLFFFFFPPWKAQQRRGVLFIYIARAFVCTRVSVCVCEREREPKPAAADKLRFNAERSDLFVWRKHSKTHADTLRSCRAATPCFFFFSFLSVFCCCCQTQEPAAELFAPRMN